MDLQTLLTNFRAQVQDEDPPYLWSDAEALAFAIDAQDMFVRLTGGIRDVTVPSPSTTSLTNIDVTPGQPYTAHSPYILRIRAVRLLTGNLEILPVHMTELPRLPVRDYYSTYGWGRTLQLDDTDYGDVNYAVLGVKKGSIRWLRVPSPTAAADTARLVINRLPFPRIAKAEDALEIDEQHHFHLIKWMRHLAYSKPDAETFDRKGADAAEAAFRSYCADASIEEGKQRYKPGTVQFGGVGVW